jgi:hypothetical protein
MGICRNWCLKNKVQKPTTYTRKPSAMKLFFLMIPLLGVHCITTACFQKIRERKPDVKKEIVAFQILPGNLLMHFN